MPDEKTEDWGSFEQAEDWRRESFLARTPAQRLVWLKSALKLRYQAMESRGERTFNEEERGSDA
ncbi:MAG: hypothetical protein AAGB29_02115 [Planctomycetota bacterium]